MNIVTPNKNLSSTITTVGDGRKITTDLSKRTSPRAKKPSLAAKSKKTEEEAKLDDAEVSISNQVEEMLIDAKLPADEKDIGTEIIENKTSTYILQKKGKVEKMYGRYQRQWMEHRDSIGLQDEYKDTELVRFFKGRRAKYAPSTLWVIYACLNAYFIEEYGKNLNNLPRLTRYLKSQTHLYVTKKSRTFTPEQIHEVLMHDLNSKNPRDTIMGVIVSILYYGLLRSSECMDITVGDVEVQWDGKVEITFNHPRKRRNEGFKYWVPAVYEDLYHLYMSQLKNKSDKSSRFLKNYNKRSKKRVQNCGRNTVNSAVSHCCSILKLPEDGYTSHAFRRSAATNLADAGVGLTNLKRHGQWKSPAAAEGYISNSVPLRREREQMLLPEAIRGAKKAKSTTEQMVLEIIVPQEEKCGKSPTVSENKHEPTEIALETPLKTAKVILQQETPKTPTKEKHAPTKMIWNPYKKRLVETQVSPSITPYKKQRTMSPTEKLLDAFKDSKATFNNCTFVFGNQSN